MRTNTTLKVLLTAGLLALTGCETVPERAQQVGDDIAEANDAILETAERTVCFGASAGALTRRYGTNPERFQAWQKFCQHGTWPTSDPVQ